MSWGELVAQLTQHVRGDLPKDQLPGWVPVKLKPGAERRLKVNVESVSCLVFDYDDIELEQWSKVHEVAAGLSYCWHSSYSHEPLSGQLRYRVVVQLDRPVLAAEWPQFYSVVSSAFHVGQSSGARGKAKSGQPDEQCSDPNRFYYGPYCPQDAAPDAGHRDGAPLGVDDMLAMATPARPGAAKAGRPQSPRPLARRDIMNIIPKSWRKIDNPFIHQGYQGLVNAMTGESFAPSGKRDDTLLAISAILSDKFPDRTPEDIIDPFADALDIDEPELGWPRASLLDKLERDLALQEDAAEAARGQALKSINRQEGYTAAQLDAWAARLGLSHRDELASMLLLHKRGQVWCFYEGDWHPMGHHRDAEPDIHARLAAATAVLPVALGEETIKGWKDKPMKVLLVQYGRIIDRVVKSLELQHSYVEGTTLYHATCPRDASLQPCYNQHVQRWLESWGEPAILDWCATAPKLGKPTAALILDGAKRTGKTMLAKGIARLWGHDRATPLADLSSNFNDSISRCPVLYAEESVPWEFRRDTGLLKELITADSQQLRQKYQDNSTLVGAIRLVIARNDHKLFEAGEVLTKATVDALCDRLLYVYTGTTPAPYFEPKVVAEHILWLEQNHKPAPSDRDGLWVTGRPSRLHYRMRAFTSKYSVSVCHWLVSFVEKPQLCQDTGRAQHRLDSQGLQVTPRLVYDRWESYCGKEIRQPTLAQIADALGGISTRNKHLYKVDLDVLAEYADHIGSELGDRSTLQSKIEASNAELARATN